MMQCLHFSPFRSPVMHLRHKKHLAKTATTRPPLYKSHTSTLSSSMVKQEATRKVGSAIAPDTGHAMKVFIRPQNACCVHLSRLFELGIASACQRRLFATHVRSGTHTKPPSVGMLYHHPLRLCRTDPTILLACLHRIFKQTAALNLSWLQRTFSQSCSKLVTPAA